MSTSMAYEIQAAKYDNFNIKSGEESIFLAQMQGAIDVRFWSLIYFTVKESL